MKLDDVRWLSLAVRHGSISAAARRERKPISTIARRIAALEADLDVPLLIRGRDGARATQEGEILLKAYAKAGEALGRLGVIARDLKGEALDEPVTVTATEPIIAGVLAPKIADLLDRQPGLKLRLCSEPNVVSLAAGDADIAVRLAKPVGDSLLMRRIATLKLGLFTSRAYLAGRNPAALDLQKERLLGYDDSFGPIQEVMWFDEQRLASSLALRTPSTRALFNAAAAGAGIALLPAFIAADSALVEVPAPGRPLNRPVWLLSQKATVRRPRVRLVWDWAIQAFSSLK